MKSAFLFVPMIFIGLGCFAQTKLISHRSHSGSNTHFLTSLENSLFDLPESNFGGPPIDHSIPPYNLTLIYTERLDSVIRLTDTSVALVKSSHYYKSLGDNNDLLGSRKQYKEIIYNDPLLSQKHSLDSIKKAYLRDYQLYSKKDSISLAIKNFDPSAYLAFWSSIIWIESNGYHYENSPDSVKFIGYDNEKPKKRKHKKGFFLPFFSDENSDPFDSVLWLLVLFALGIAAITGWKSWKISLLNTP